MRRGDLLENRRVVSPLACLWAWFPKRGVVVLWERVAMSKRMQLVSVIACCLVFVAAVSARGEALSIYEVQYTTNPDGASDYVGEVIDCAGGICVSKFPGYRPRLILQDPAQPDGWGAIQVKDWIAGHEMFNSVEVGDWVSFTNMMVEDFRGTTMLGRQSAYFPGYTIVSSGNPLPPITFVSVAEILAPVEYPGFEWHVENHNAERYESMRLMVRDVTVMEMDHGKAQDNYALQDDEGVACWAADYMNESVGPWGYHSFVELERHFCAVGGVFEQYTNIANGWDYYQLVTTMTVDLLICGDFDHDGDVDIEDVPGFVDALVGGTAADASAADVNRDERENGEDIEFFLAAILFP